MRFVSTRAHGVIDYIFALLLLVSPWLFGFAEGGAAMWVPVAVGAGIVLQALVTDYELSLVRALPMPVHLGVDVVGGLFLMVSPWLLGFSSAVWVPHVVFGAVAVGAALATRTQPNSRPMSTT